MKNHWICTFFLLSILLTSCCDTSYLSDYSINWYGKEYKLDLDLFGDDEGQEMYTEPPVTMMNCEEMTLVIQEYAVELKHQKRLSLEDSKAYFDDGIHTVQMQFSSQDLKTMDEARQLLVDVVEGLLAKLNEDIFLGPDFASFPFSANNLEIYITFESFYGFHIDPYYINWICLENGTAAYYTFDLRDNEKNCWHVRREPYSKSREIVLYERQGEELYKQRHQPNKNIFGGQRFYQPQ